ncbi:MAG TPA: hypothetical protein VGH39_02525 [Xanthobacteraceae bacterium]
MSRGRFQILFAQILAASVIEGPLVLAADNNEQWLARKASTS